MTIVQERPSVRASSRDREHRRDRTAALFAAASLPDNIDRLDELREEVLLINMGVARSVARRFAQRGIDLEDLEQVACEALVKAIRRFDASRNHDFLAYAVPTIRGEVQRHFRDLGWMVKPTRRVQENQQRSARMAEDLSAELGRRPDTAELVSALGISAREHAEAESARGCFHATSLDQRLSDDGETGDIGSTLAADDRDLPACEARMMVIPALLDLTERERHVVYMRYFEDRTQNEIGADIGVGQAQVSRILASALDGMRCTLEGRVAS
ncbi:sigma-70 family RNA polymerase sigma factor [Nocardioides currus]|uniref:RNA polymerase subunit sigma-70 n=1 Tax=Nocardioides currus TaxID=2133958 RepID=A0A2R7YUV8_9ACTN|nr:sigma-70 family RNA polymerase sigma factor [Nocardioides currus]PUA80162.1 RNA polymerase subunit sigma-70 [Nocardioides currus]